MLRTMRSRPALTAAQVHGVHARFPSDLVAGKLKKHRKPRIRHVSCAIDKKHGHRQSSGRFGSHKGRSSYLFLSRLDIIARTLHPFRQPLSATEIRLQFRHCLNCRPALPMKQGHKWDCENALRDDQDCQKHPYWRMAVICQQGKCQMLPTTQLLDSSLEKDDRGLAE